MKEKEQTAADILNVWASASAHGTEFFVAGEAVSYGEAVLKAVKEDGSYMADYIPDESGGLRQIRLDRVSRD